jgi:Ca-activated chloride channel family protein
MTRANDPNDPQTRKRLNPASLTVRTDRTLVRSTHRSERFVLVELTAPPRTTDARREPVNVAFVLDRSGSMSGRKIELARKAVEVAIDRLLPEDRFAVVAYDDRIDVVVESTPASREAKDGALARIRSIDARGSTDLGGGWLRGAEQVARQLEHAKGGGVHRVLLLTDGLANQGMTDPAELTRHAAELRARGVSTTTFGVGEDFDERLLAGMADAGGGHFYFMERPEQIPDLIASEVGELIEIVARDATLEVTATDGLEIEPLSPFPMERRGNRTAILLGDLVAEQRLEAIVRIRCGYGTLGSEVGVLVGVTDRDGALAAAGLAPIALAWRYADDATNDAQPRDRSVDRRVAALFAARARQEAIGLNRAGSYTAAVAQLRAVARRIEGYAGSDAELRELAHGLSEDEQRWAAPAPEATRKAAFADASYALRSRGPEGRAGRY